ncbi:MAG TPA: alpha-glucan family phosphorylase, partial [Fimbriimonadaceae bacterium]|nr:alpha-glucan family phosphorylase [Fimbriimonadaceae bacterium]
MKYPKFSHSFEVVADFPESLSALRVLASNYRFSWNHEVRELFRMVDKEIWEEVNHNPIALLLNLPPDRAAKLSANQHFMARLAACAKDLETYLSESTWFDQTFPGAREHTSIAYFCAEFGLSEGLPIYSGGLGVLAGDHLKAASDLGLPLVGVGLLYSRGYFRQRLNHDGWQQEVYPQYDYYSFPLDLMRDERDEPLRVEVEFPDRIVTCQIWKAAVGRITMYLLDSNVLENAPNDQSITDTLYGGDEEIRVRQEMILGIGGMKALRAVGINPTVCHMNEGHAAFLSIERIRQFMADHGVDFKTARQVVVAGNVFTTHTPVPAGFDLFSPELLERYMGKSVAAAGLDFPSFLELGRIDPENTGEAFNMAVLAMENANFVNGVSKLHAKVTRSMFSDRWPSYPEDEVPVEAVTNGIHTMTWVSKRMAALFDEYLGKAWRTEGGEPAAWAGIENIPDEDLWAVREDERGDLIRFIRKRVQHDQERLNVAKPDFNTIGAILDPRVLTIGFARRFATYKRASLMLTDRVRLKNILFHPERPVQIVIAGKAHPRDDAGKHIIQDLVNFIRTEAAQARIAFVEDYDIEVARHLVQGVDVWLNNPRRPMEASGTSGMKVVPNGGLNCSVLDGWWDEGYDPSFGFAIGEPIEMTDAGHQDWLDSRSLYAIIEREIAPKFYHRVDNGLPTSWIAMMKASMKRLAPQFSTLRMVREYAERAYMPASNVYRALEADNLAKAREAREWRERVQKSWASVSIRDVTDTAGRKPARGGTVCLKATVSLGQLTPDDVAVEAIVGKIGANRDLMNTEAVRLTPAGKEG